MGRAKASPKAKPKGKKVVAKKSVKSNSKSKKDVVRVKKEPTSRKRVIKAKRTGRKRAQARASKKSKKEVKTRAPKMEIHEGGFPDFIWVHVFQHLQASEICMLRRTNKAANAVAHSAEMMRNLWVREFKFYPRGENTALFYQKRLLENWQELLDPHVALFSQQKQIRHMALEIDQLYENEIEDCEYRTQHFDEDEWFSSGLLKFAFARAPSSDCSGQVESRAES